MTFVLPEYLDQLVQIQHGILTAHQAHEGGLSSDAVRSCLRSGRWQQLQHGVYATFTGEPGRQAVLWAAVLRAGRSAVLSHYTAAELHALTDWSGSSIHVTIPESRRIAPIRGVVLHLSQRAEVACHPTQLPPRTRIEETILDLTQVAATAEDACAWIARGLGRRLTTQDRLGKALGHRQRTRFRAELSEALSEDFAGVHAALEYRYVKLVELPHCLPKGQRQAPAVRDGRREYRDVLYDEYNLIVELDGRAAHPAESRWRDIRRDNAAAAGGRMTLRYGSDDLRTRPCLVADQVYQALSRSAPVSARPCSPACPVTRSRTR